MTIDKRAARLAWKEREKIWTVYAARTGGGTWVGVTGDLKAAENMLGFSLRTGGCRAAGMQNAYDGTLAIDALEELDPDLGPLARQEAIKARRAHWCAELNATPILR